MTLKKKINILFIGISIILSPILVFHLYREQENLSKEYPRITFNSSLSGTVVEIFHNHGVFVKLSNGTQCSTGDKLIDNKGSDMGLFLIKNDSIYKKADSDTLYVIRGDKTFIYTYRPW